MKLKKLHMGLRSIGLSATQIGVKFAAYEDKNGNTLEVAGALEVGADCSKTNDDGSLTTCEDGEYELTDGTTIVVSGGKISEVKPTAVVEGEMAAEPPAETPAESAAVSREEFDALASSVAKIAEMLQSLVQSTTEEEGVEMEAMKKQVACASQEVEALKTELSQTHELVKEMGVLLSSVPAAMLKGQAEPPVNPTKNKANDPISRAIERAKRIS